MRSKQDDDNGPVKVFQAILPGYPDRVESCLYRRLFRDRCTKCDLPSHMEIDSPPKIRMPDLKQDIGLACGFWLARKEFAQLLCAEFEDQFEMRKIADDAYFLILKNILIPDDPFYEDAGDRDLMFFKDKERICSLCNQPYILLCKGFLKFKGDNRIKPRTIYETSLKFGSADVKYPMYFCDEEAADALRAISRKFKFVSSTVKFSIDTT